MKCDLAMSIVEIEIVVIILGSSMAGIDISEFDGERKCADLAAPFP